MDNRKYRTIPLNGKYGEGKHAIVDAEDYERLSQYSWHVNDLGYVMRYRGSCSTGWRMHWDVIGEPPPGLEGDHKNGDTLDNRRQNLRFATRAQNTQNRKSWGEIDYKGVCMDGDHVKACMKIQGRQIYLGPYPDPESAARSYDAFAFHFYGEYARLNFPDRQPMHPIMASLLRTDRSVKRTPDLYGTVLRKLEKAGINLAELQRAA